MNTDDIFAERFLAVLTEENPSQIPRLTKFTYPGKYPAALHQGPTASIYRVWYGPSDNQFTEFPGKDFLQYFGRLLGTPSI